MRIRVLFALLACLATATASPAGPQSITWRNWNTGLSAAASTGKPVLVDVHTDWCTWCKRMDRDVYSRADVREYLERKFVTIKLNAESDESVNYGGHSMTARALASTLNVTGYPTSIFLTRSGDHLANVPGYLPADRLLLLLRYIGDGHMDRGTSCDDYVKRAGSRR